tara:strand:- start:293 stop:832 length:540 start_codon:yes stop_codon:yes gene_type:complete
MNIHLLKNYNFTQIKIFFKEFEESLIKIYLTSYYKYGKGLIYVDINKIINNKCNTHYIPLTNREKFWNQSKNIINIKNVIIKDKINKYYLWLIDKNISIFFERQCTLKDILYKDKRKNPIILYNKIKNAIVLYKEKKEQKEQKNLEAKKIQEEAKKIQEEAKKIQEEEEEEQFNFIVNN